MDTATRLGPYQEVRLPQGLVRYREAGSGPPLVFIHGLLVNGDLWRRVVPHLAGEFRCIVPDLPLGAHLPAMDPGADLTPPGLARLVADFLAALDLRDATLVGSDTGGGIAQIVIARHPERIGRLVLTNCDAYEHFPPPLVLPFKWGAFVPGFVPALALALRAFPPAGRLLYALLAHHNPGRAVLTGFFAPLGRDPGVRRDVARALRGVDKRHTLAAARAFPAFRKPVLIVWGEDDLVFPMRDAARLAHDFPAARLVPVARSRAFVCEDQPERLAALITQFVREPIAAAA
jgi:pimeloyl-ACP methyl ester carboxylesterase